MIKTKKSDFMKKLEELLLLSSLIAEDADVVIFVGMALVQILTVNSELATFSDMASGYLSYVLGKARYLSQTVKAIVHG
ncbi:hypothetical protein DPMN_181378 [Dreissena polymorpha]|uniref:Uncharacterized protein n=1 Tax=Dreissena polymorpha TaxID=45954 RepID=A0A9D4DDE9_DREPO|nr:hypothetical protein DPMN_181378 [Dreissena polymorpha]